MPNRLFGCSVPRTNIQIFQANHRLLPNVNIYFPPKTKSYAKFDELSLDVSFQ